MVKRRRVAVVGLGRFGSSLARTLAEIGHEVLAVDVSMRAVQEVSEIVTHAAQADATDLEALEELGLGQFETVVAAVGADIGPSILVTVHLKKLGVPNVIARAHNDLHGEILTKVGADRLVFPEQEMGQRLAHSFAVPHTVDYLSVGPAYGISKLKPPPELIGQSVSALAPRSQDYSLLMIERGTQVILHPREEDLLREGDLLVIAGRDEAMERLWQGQRHAD